MDRTKCISIFDFMPVVFYGKMRGQRLPPYNLWFRRLYVRRLENTQDSSVARHGISFLFTLQAPFTASFAPRNAFKIKGINVTVTLLL